MKLKNARMPGHSVFTTNELIWMIAAATMVGMLIGFGFASFSPDLRPN
jgi:hypothetical protein